MVVGQDWGDEAWFVREAGQTTSTSVTNKALIKLLDSIGFEIPPARDSPDRGALFFTNAILCLKQGGAQGRVQPQWFENCGSRFLRHLIELVRPPRRGRSGRARVPRPSSRPTTSSRATSALTSRLQFRFN